MIADIVAEVYGGPVLTTFSYQTAACGLATYSIVETYPFLTNTVDSLLLENTLQVETSDETVIGTHITTMVMSLNNYPTFTFPDTVFNIIINQHSCAAEPN